MDMLISTLGYGFMIVGLFVVIFGVISIYLIWQARIDRSKSWEAHKQLNKIRRK